MNTIQDLREWAGVKDGTQDALLRQIEGGVVRLLEKATNRRFTCPPERIAQMLNGPPVHTGGLSQDDPGPQQWVTLREEPLTILSGTFTIIPGGTAVVGVGTLATQELSAAPPSAVSFDGGDPLLIDEITDDLNFSLAEPHADGVTAANATAELIGVETRREGDKTWDEIDPREVEVDRRRVYSPDNDFYPGRGTVRITYRQGFQEGQGPEDVTLLVLEMVKSAYVRKRRRSSSVAVPGAFRVTWASFKDEAAGFKEKADLLARPLTFGG